MNFTTVLFLYTSAVTLLVPTVMSRSLGFKNCYPKDAVQYFEVTHVDQAPDHVSIPGRVDVTLTGIVKRHVSGGTIRVKVSKKILWFRVDVEKATLDMCRTLSDGYECPLVPGVTKFVYSLKIPFLVPRTTYDVHYEARSARGTLLSCTDFTTDLRHSAIT